MARIPYTVYRTEYSAFDEAGDYETRTEEYEIGNASFRELVDMLRFYSHPSQSPLPANDGRLWVTSEPELDFRDGTYSEISIHLDGPDCPRLARYWCKAVRTALAR